MKKDWLITRDAFAKFLAWLDPDPAKAGEKYKEIHHRLVIIFTYRGCADAEELADVTINRVIRRAQEMAPDYSGDPVPYFIKVANNLYREIAPKRAVWSGLTDDIVQQPADNSEDEREYECLELCMARLTPANRALVLEYYRDDKQDKINRRKKLAKEMRLGLNALRIRAHRIRRTLERCIDECLAGNSSHEMDQT